LPFLELKNDWNASSYEFFRMVFGSCGPNFNPYFLTNFFHLSDKNSILQHSKFSFLKLSSSSKKACPYRLNKEDLDFQFFS
jgi:hypothetical protein